MRLDGQAIRRLRPAKSGVDPWRPHGVVDEEERVPGPGTQRCRTIFLAGAECPFTCVFCDLWRFTIDGPTPLGALPRQIDLGLAVHDDYGIDSLKLYNASNFFDPRAVPPEDHEAIAERCKAFARVVVECHPRLVDDRCRCFQRLLEPDLEIALGLETVHPEALPRLNKGMTLDDFTQASEFAREHDMAVRAFVLIGAPYVPLAETTDWLERSVRFAIAHGASHVAMIPVRPGNGALDRLARESLFAVPSLSLIERCFEVGLAAQTTTSVVSLDLWEIQRHPALECCADQRVSRLHRMNRAGSVRPPIECPHCEGGR